MTHDAWSAFRRKPDNERVGLPWNTEFKPNLGGHIRKWDERPYVPLSENGILDHLIAGLEEETNRMNRRTVVLLGKR